MALNVMADRDDHSCADLLVETSTAPVQIFNINADQLPLVVAHMAPRLRPDAVRISIPFWELSHYPDAWLPGLATMDEIWAPTRFITRALEGRLDKKVIYMPVALELKSPAPLPRARFGLPQARFLFFFCASTSCPLSSARIPLCRDSGVPRGLSAAREGGIGG